MPSAAAPSRRQPWPYDLIIDADGVGVSPVGFMLKPQEDGQFVGRKAEPIQATPSDFEYSSSSPFLERTVEFQHLTMGFGERVQPTGIARRTRVAIGVDTSVNGECILGPYFHEVTVQEAKSITGFVEAGDGAGGVVLLCMATDKLWKSTDGGDTWSQANINNSADLTNASVQGAGATFNNAVRFKHSGGSAVDRVYFGCSGGASADRLVYADFTVSPALFSVAGAAEGPFTSGGAGGPARFVEVNGRELWVAKDNLVTKCEADPLLAASYSGTFSVGKAAGDSATRVTWMATNNNALYVFKENGIFTMNTDGSTNDLFPGLRSVRSSLNGKNARAWGNSLYANYGDSFFRLNQDGSLESIGAELLLSNDTEVSGRPVAWVGHNTWFLYEILYNSLTNSSYLLKYGAWNESDDGRLNDVVEFRSTHHGALKKFDGKTATCMTIHTFGTQQRLIVGFSDGTIEWCYLPKNTPNPAAPNSGCQFDTSGYVQFPLVHGGFKADQKLFRGFSVFGANLTADYKATLDYRALESNTWIPLEDDLGDPAEFTTPAQRLDFPSGTSPRSKYLDIRLNLSAVADPGQSFSTTTPRIEGLGIHLQVRPAFIEEYIMTVVAKNFLSRHNGTIDRRSADQLRSKALEVAERVGTCIVALPNGRQEEMTFTGFAERQYAREDSYGVEYEIDLRAIQYKTLTTETEQNTTNLYTYTDLEAYTYTELEALNPYG